MNPVNGYAGSKNQKQTPPMVCLFISNKKQGKEYSLVPLETTSSAHCGIRKRKFNMKLIS